MMPYCSKTRKIEYFFELTKKAQGYERSRYGYTLKCLSIPLARDLDIAWSRFSYSDYNVIPTLKIIV